MCDKESPGEWSVVLYDTSSTHLEEFLKKAENVFGKQGLSLLGLIFATKEHFPTEICGGLTENDAKRIAGELSGDNLVIAAKPTSELCGLKHRADEVWATRCAGGYHFTEVDGLIIILVPINARENVARMKGKNPGIKSWEIERALNHDHIAFNRPDDLYIDDSEREVERLRTALKLAYPDVTFTISIRPGSIISFWQTTEDSPKGSCIPDEKNESGESWCHKCRQNQKYETIDYVDDRHPNVEWGKCQVCGERIITQTCVKLIHI